MSHGNSVFDQLATGLGGNFPDVDQDQRRQALALALLTSGLSTLGSAGTQGIGGIVPGLQQGLGTLQGVLEGASQRQAQQQQLGFQQQNVDLRGRQVDLAEQQFTTRQQAATDAAAQEAQEDDFLRFTAETFRDDPTYLDYKRRVRYRLLPGIY